MSPSKKLAVEKTPGHWRVTLDNPPINLIGDATYDELYDLVEAIEAETALKVLTLQIFAWEGFPARAPKLVQRGIGQAGEFELDLGRSLGDL